MFESIEKKTDTLRRSSSERKEALVSLKRLLDAEWTFAEMAVSGTPLARMDVRRMIESKNDPQSRVRILREACNFYRATQFVERFVPRAPRELGEAELLGAHAVLARGIDDAHAAQLRMSALAETEPGRAAEVSELHTTMNELYLWLRSSTHQHAIRQASELILRLMYAQPFVLMNGRLARLFANLVLMQRGLPPALFTGDDRAPFCETVMRAPKDGGWALVQLLSSAVERTLDLCLETVERTPVLAQARV